MKKQLFITLGIIIILGCVSVCMRNPNPKLKSRPLMGLNLLEGLKFSSGMWEDGTIYDPKTGKTYSCQIQLKSSQVLEVKGYIGFSLIGRTVEWTKVKR
jgi:uncharacterized protein (DUF2147 family)